jgi:hypothetical protein
MELTPIYIASQVFIIISYIFLALTYFLKNRKAILTIGFLMIIFTGLSYLCLKAWTGLAMVGVALIRNIIFLTDEKKGKGDTITKKDIIILIILYLISGISAIYAYNGFLSLLSVFATCTYTYSVWQKKTLIYKMLGIPTSLLWILYNIFIMSLFGIILESILLVFEITGFYMEWKKPKVGVHGDVPS